MALSTKSKQILDEAMGGKKAADSLVAAMSANATLDARQKRELEIAIADKKAAKAIADDIAAVKSEISTISNDGSWTSGSVTYTINGRGYTQAFVTSHNASVDALAAQLAADQDVLSAVANAGRTIITITSKPAVSLTIVKSADTTDATWTAASESQAAVASVVDDRTKKALNVMMITKKASDEMEAEIEK